MQSVIDLGELASCGVFPRADEPDPLKAPLELLQCEACGLVQLAHDYDGEDLYQGRYGYRSGINESMVRHLGTVTDTISSRIDLQKGDVVLDIGSNDGTLLKSYPDLGLTRIGIDPTIARFANYYDASIITVPDFFSAGTYSAKLAGRKARVITSISMFYDLPDPMAFVRDIASVLADDGIWVLEQSYLPAMLERRSFDTICHEHLEYYCLHQIKRLCEDNGLRVVDVEFNDVNGGSFQVTVCQRNGTVAERHDAAIAAILAAERKSGFLTPMPFQKFGQEIVRLRARVLTFLVEQKRRGKVVHGYGASTKGNTLLQLFGITADLLPAIADRNPDKDGAHTPGSGIPIITEARSRQMRPDVYFVLPWHFRDSFIAREREFLEDGGTFVFPLPDFEVYAARRATEREAPAPLRRKG
jgi:NDP-4-keto-2,6-dideoxyhexose 3-C-methyltransferase